MWTTFEEQLPANTLESSIQILVKSKNKKRVWLINFQKKSDNLLECLLELNTSNNDSYFTLEYLKESSEDWLPYYWMLIPE